MDIIQIAVGLSALLGISVGIIRLIIYLRALRARNLRAEVVQEGDLGVPRILFSLSKDRSKVANNLPPRTHFVGRNEQLQDLLGALQSRSYIVVIEGIGGVGKTSLALELCHQILKTKARVKPNSKSEKNLDETEENQFHSIVWVSAKETRPTLEEVFDTIAKVLSYPYILKLEGSEKSIAIQKLLRNETALIVIDNFETITDTSIIGFLQNLPEPSKAIVTSRHKTIRDAKALHLVGLDAQESKDLILTELKNVGLKGLNLNEDHFDQLYKATGGVPLVIKWAIGQIKFGEPFDNVLEKLHQAEGNIFENVFADSWSKLDTISKQILLVASLVPSPISRDAIIESLGIFQYQLDRFIEDIIKLSLIEPTDDLTSEKRRYQIHVLTRSFVKKEFANDLELVTKLNIQLASYYSNLAKSFSDVWIQAENVDKLERSLDNILATAHWSYVNAKTSDDWKRVADFAFSTYDFLWGRGYWDDFLTLGNRAIEATVRLGDSTAQANLWNKIGRINLWRGNLVKAKQSAQKIKIAFENGGGVGNFELGNRLDAQISLYEGHYKEAEGVLMRILNNSDERPDDEGMAAILVELGIAAHHLEDYKTAKDRFNQALKLDEKLETLEGQAVSLSHLAQTLFSLGEYEDAQSAYERGQYLAESTNRISTVARCQLGLAEIHKINGALDKSLSLAQLAYDGFNRSGMQREIKETLELIEQLKK